MDYITIVFMAIGLGMDCFAVSIAKSACLGGVNLPKFLLMAFCFGLFQGFMPLIGYLIGSSFAEAISAYDHYIAFFILAAIGINMIVEDAKELREARKAQAEGRPIVVCNPKKDPYSLKVIMALSVATSIDALASGLVFLPYGEWIWRAVAIIGAASFLMSLAGQFIGAYWGKKQHLPFGIVGGVILIVIGVKILLEHLCG